MRPDGRHGVTAGQFDELLRAGLTELAGPEAPLTFVRADGSSAELPDQTHFTLAEGPSEKISDYRRIEVVLDGAPAAGARGEVRFELTLADGTLMVDPLSFVPRSMRSGDLRSDLHGAAAVVAAILLLGGTSIPARAQAMLWYLLGELQEAATARGRHLRDPRPA